MASRLLEANFYGLGLSLGSRDLWPCNGLAVQAVAFSLPLKAAL